MALTRHLTRCTFHRSNIVSEDDPRLHLESLLAVCPRRSSASQFPKVMS